MDAPIELERRLRALSEYEILDTEAEHSFDEIVFIAKTICDAPAALISLVDGERQWFKARLGFEACETPLNQSVCKHGIASRDLLIIPDLTQDARTRDNALVTGEPHIRFYAGAPLITPDGTGIGMICVVDTEVRPDGLNPDQRRILAALADQVISQLELRKSLRTADKALEAECAESAMLRRLAERLELAEEAGQVGAFEWDLTTGQIAVSREFCRIHGLKEQGGYAATELMALNDAFARMAPTNPGETIRDLFEHDEFAIRRASDNEERWVSIRARVINDEAGAPITFAGIATDVTDQRLINNEISHRLKNTLALVQAVAGHTLRNVADPGPVQEFNRRVAALATAHDILLSRTRAAACLHEICEGVLARLSIAERVKRSGKDVEISSRASLVLSMLLHELGTNAMKYGALSRDGGAVTLQTSVEKREDGDWVILHWQETGGPPVTEPEKRGLGTRLIERGLAPDGETEIRFEPTGFSAMIASPMRQIKA